MMKLEQMQDERSKTIYKMEYIEGNITVIKYFQDVEGELDKSKLKPTENGLIVEIK